MKILPRFKTVLVTTFGYKKEIQHWETCLYYVLQFQTTGFFLNPKLPWTLILKA